MVFLFALAEFPGGRHTPKFACKPRALAARGRSSRAKATLDWIVLGESSRDWGALVAYWDALAVRALAEEQHDGEDAGPVAHRDGDPNAQARKLCRLVANEGRIREPVQHVR